MNRLAPALVLIGLVALLLASRQTAGAAELLVNGGFESGTSGWAWSDGTLTAVAGPVHGGSAAARFSADAQPSVQTVYQVRDLAPGQTYQLSGWIVVNDPSIHEVRLIIDWLDSGGSLAGFEYSISSLEHEIPGFRYLSTSVVTAPQEARSARVSVRVRATSDFNIYLDDFSFDGPLVTPPPSAAPSPTATLNPTLAPTPPPTATTTTPTTTIAPAPTSPMTPLPSTPVAPTKTPTPAPVPTPGGTSSPVPFPNPTVTPGVPPPSAPTPTASTTATPFPTESPVIEPTVFAQLANGGFEETRDDGSPYAWRKFGGLVEVVTTYSHQGSTSVRFSSSTTSTKWVHQTIAVNGSEYYEASGYALKNDPDVADVFLRVSFYVSDDGLGPAIATADSLETLSDDNPNFRRLSTGAVQTPPNARTARLRLMLRPSSDAPAEAYFDAMSFVRVPEPIDVLTGLPPSPNTTSHTAAEKPTLTNASSAGGANETDHRARTGARATPVLPAALAATFTPARLANVGPSSASTGIDSPNASRDDNDWLILLAIALPAIGLATVGARELHRTFTEKQ